MTSMIGSSALNVIADGFQRAVLSLVLLLSMTGFVVAQETAATDADKPAATTEEGAESAESVAAENIPAPDASEEDAASSEEGSVIPGFILLAIVIALFVVPMFVGSSLAKSLKMPDHGWKFSLGLGTLAAAAVVISQGEVKFGPDLSGGITLIYELQDTSAQAEDGDPAEDQEDQSNSAKQRLVRQLIGALTERVDPSGTKEVTIREYGLGQIEIIIPKASQQELDFIERRIYTAGALEFRITASPVFEEHRQIIELAKLLPPGEKEVHLGDKKVAEWMAYDVEKFGPAEHLVTRTAGSVPQALIMMNDELNVTGEFLKKASSDFDEQGRPQVSFNFNPIGAFRFGRLTGKHVPNPSGQEYHLGIILDKKLLSAPSIISKITDQGRITGGMGPEEVDFIVSILNAGSLPATLNKDPISREQISPTLGAETVEMGRTAILYSLMAVMIFMLFYYRFAGVVACVALAANLLLILGLMVLFKAAFTLPGLAGLVLTIGMSVDANVLIFERIREERNRGAALRMAIRNGFARATQTIVDANVTTLITAIVIYKIAPDNVKGFGVMLIIGIVMSMYTAIFLSRIIFDVAEKTRKISELGMAQIIGKTDFNFLNKAIAGAIVSTILIAIGIFAVSQRGKDLLNIDFTGGSSVTLVLNDDAKMSFSEVKELLDETELKDKNLSLVEVGVTQTQYKVSSVNQDVEGVQEILHETFGDKLKTYHVELQEVTSLTSQADHVGPVVHLVNFQEETKEEATEETAAEPAEEKAVAEESEKTDAEETPADEPLADPFAGGTSAKLVFNMGEGQEEDAGISYDSAAQLVGDALEATGHSGTAMAVSNPNYQVGSVRRFSEWEVKLALPESEASQVFAQLETVTNSQPIFPLANKIGGRVAGDMKTKAIAAIVISLVGIVAYIWFRFQHVMYGLAAVVALIHDVLVTLGMIALSAFLVDGIPDLAGLLLVEKFQISLPIVAAFLTIIGYSLNDTIVVFDRIREVKGKSPNLTSETINTSINQTLGRTLLTSLTTLLSVILLYVLGGDGIHGFAFSLVVGVIVGTYSSIFIASPVLLWMSQRGQQASTNSGPKAA
ncbi:MAG: protein translocase subunit SecD [Planctomycetes bacterium]|nr:protein translocase subunit SecD [Planctomycetota bacterium]